MNAVGFDYLMVATLTENRSNDERQAQYYRELRREAELQERNRQAWKARWNAVRSLFAATTKRPLQTGVVGPVATAS
ncbi:hypothetical protein [Hwanghaeella sp.]|uniref:hypothetical protein n=1 Tax=Hwanghaeella sp. TaxID=2605943 RepID=UPI003CCC0B93